VSPDYDFGVGSILERNVQANDRIIDRAYAHLSDRKYGLVSKIVKRTLLKFAPSEREA